MGIWIIVIFRFMWERVFKEGILGDVCKCNEVFGFIFGLLVLVRVLVYVSDLENLIIFMFLKLCL